MQPGEPVRHRTRPDCGIGVIEAIYSNDTCKAKFGDVLFSGIPRNALQPICWAVDSEYQLVKPKKRLLFDAGGHPSEREQTLFVQPYPQPCVQGTDDRGAALPEHWGVSTTEYRLQVFAKRNFWRSKNVSLLETHTGMTRNGREDFERQLKRTLEGAGIQCWKLSKQEIVRRVFENDVAISRMADLFAQFIRRAKKRGWSPDEVARRINEAPDQDPRARLFHELALRGYREYQDMLVEQQAMDFDDLLMQAADEVKARGASASIHLGQGRMIPIGDLRWILVDEYQDFSELYFRMLGAILEVNRTIRVVAVGDDWQAINGYAGAELVFFWQFEK